MENFIFIDNWALTEYTKDDKRQYLSKYINDNRLCIICDSFTFVELYNPIINENDQNDRVSRACRFISLHNAIIVDQVDIFRQEFFSYPEKICDIPSKLDLRQINQEYRYITLLNFFKRDIEYLKMGKDIADWVKNYHNLKQSWLQDVETIKRDALDKGLLHINIKGEFEKLQESKNDFLQYLDRRFFSFLSSNEREQLGEKIIPLYTDSMNKLKSIHYTSLCFWYKYIEKDKSYTMNDLDSDIGDFYQMSLIPYCSVFTLDKHMQYLGNKINQETNYACKLLNKKLFDKEIGLN